MPATPPPELLAAAQRAAGQSALSRLAALGWSTDEILAALDDGPTEAALPGRVAAAWRAALPQARHDFAEAVAVGMTGAAVMTFRASAALAGISAANAYHQAERGPIPEAVPA